MAWQRCVLCEIYRCRSRPLLKPLRNQRQLSLPRVLQSRLTWPAWRESNLLGGLYPRPAILLVLKPDAT